MRKPARKTAAAPAEPPAQNVAAAPAEAAVHIVEMPTLGRIVIVLGRHVTAPAPEGTHGQHMPAIVTRVHSPMLIDATLFPPGGAAPNSCVRIHYGEAPGEWCWPRRMATLDQAE